MFNKIYTNLVVKSVEILQSILPCNVEWCDEMTSYHELGPLKAIIEQAPYEEDTYCIRLGKLRFIAGPHRTTE